MTFAFGMRFFAESEWSLERDRVWRARIGCGAGIEPRLGVRFFHANPMTTDSQPSRAPAKLRR